MRSYINFLWLNHQVTHTALPIRHMSQLYHWFSQTGKFTSLEQLFLCVTQLGELSVMSSWSWFQSLPTRAINSHRKRAPLLNVKQGLPQCASFAIFLNLSNHYHIKHNSLCLHHLLWKYWTLNIEDHEDRRYKSCGSLRFFLSMACSRSSFYMWSACWITRHLIIIIIVAFCLTIIYDFIIIIRGVQQHLHRNLLHLHDDHYLKW